MGNLSNNSKGITVIVIVAYTFLAVTLLEAYKALYRFSHSFTGHNPLRAKTEIVITILRRKNSTIWALHKWV